MVNRINGIDGLPITGSPALLDAIAILQSNEFTKENYQALLSLAEVDNLAGDLVEAFIVAAPNLDFIRENAI